MVVFITGLVFLVQLVFLANHVLCQPPSSSSSQHDVVLPPGLHVTLTDVEIDDILALLYLNAVPRSDQTKHVFWLNDLASVDKAANALLTSVYQAQGEQAGNNVASFLAQNLVKGKHFGERTFRHEKLYDKLYRGELYSPTEYDGLIGLLQTNYDHEPKDLYVRQISRMPAKDAIAFAKAAKKLGFTIRLWHVAAGHNTVQDTGASIEPQLNYIKALSKVVGRDNLFLTNSAYSFEKGKGQIMGSYGNTEMIQKAIPDKLLDLKLSLVYAGTNFDKLDQWFKSNRIQYDVKSLKANFEQAANSGDEGLRAHVAKEIDRVVEYARGVEKVSPSQNPISRALNSLEGGVKGILHYHQVPILATDFNQVVGLELYLKNALRSGKLVNVEFKQKGQDFFEFAEVPEGSNYHGQALLNANVKEIWNKAGHFLTK